MTILIVDDSRAMRAVMCRALARVASLDGARIVEASNGEEALSAVRLEMPDLIICDWHMPRMSGLDLVQRLRAQGSEIPFGFVTAESTPASHEEARAAGARFVVAKPFTPEDLGRALAGVV